MRNKLHKLLVVMVFAFAVASVSLTGMKVQAEASQYVEDKADLLTDEEEETLDSMTWILQLLPQTIWKGIISKIMLQITI